VEEKPPTEGDEGSTGSQTKLSSIAGFKKDDHLQADMGSALSFALRLRKRNRGASQTHNPKNDAISVKLGTSTVRPR
jgi:hypothetical protein